MSTTTTTAPILVGVGYCTADDMENYIETEVLVRLTNDRDYLANSTLNGNITNVSTSIVLADSSAFPSSGRILIGQEEIDYSSNAANTLSGLTRGVNYTVANSHSSTATVKEILNVDLAHVNYSIYDASAEIETYIGLRYSDIPLTSIPRCIRKACIDITAYNLYMRRQSIPPQYATRYTKTITFLENVRDGKVSLDSTSIYTPSTMASDTYSDDLVFTCGSKTLGTVGSLDEY